MANIPVSVVGSGGASAGPAAPSYGTAQGQSLLPPYGDPVRDRIQKLYTLLGVIGKSDYVDLRPIIRELLQLHGFTPMLIEEIMRPGQAIKVAL